MRGRRKEPARLLALLAALAAGLAFAERPVERPRYLGARPTGELTRVVTLAPSLTETVLALGAGEVLVGVSRFDERPEVKDLPRVGGFVDPSVEAVVALRPQLVLVQPSPGNKAPVEKIASLGIPVLVLPLTTVADVLRAIEAVGTALGRPDAARLKVKEIEDARASVRARAGPRRPRVLLVYGFEPLVVAGPGSFADELLRDAGAVNAASRARTAYPVYSVEAALRARPEVVIDASGGMDGSGRERLQRLAGLKAARWVTLPSQDLMHPGPSLARGLTALYELVHP